MRACSCSLALVLAQRCGLQLEPLLRGEYVGHAAAHLLQGLHLLLVGEIERFVRALGRRENVIQLLLHNIRHPLENAHVEFLLKNSDRTVA